MAYTPPNANEVDFQLPPYTPPNASAADFTFVTGVLGKGHQTSYCSGEISLTCPVEGQGHQVSYFAEELVVRIPEWTTEEEYVEYVIDHTLIDEDLYNFPIRISIGSATGKTNTDTARFVLAKLMENKFKFEIHPTYYGVPCYVEIEDWEYDKGWAELHVKVPYIPNIDRDIKLRMYFSYAHDDNTDYIGETGSVPAVAVWSNGYKEVYHFNGIYRNVANEVKNSALSDSYHLRGVGQEQVEDLIGYSQESISPDRIYGTGFDIDGLYEVTIELLTRPGTPQIGYTVMMHEVYSFDVAYSVAAFHRTTDERAIVYVKTSGTNYPYYQSAEDFLSDGSLFYGAVCFEGNIGTGQIYFNSACVFNQTGDNYKGYVVNTSDPGADCDLINFGYNHTYTTYPSYNGVFIEYRLSNVYRTPAWIKASYYSYLDSILTHTIYPSPTQEVFGASHQTSYDTNYLLQGWDVNKFIRITLSHLLIDEDLYNFPARLRIADSVGKTGFDLDWLFQSYRLGDNKFKIAVVHPMYGQCYVEVVDWEYPNWADFYVNLPHVPSTYDLEIRLYFDSEHADNTDWVGEIGSDAGKAVWDSDFLGVYHCNGEYTTILDLLLDSTSNARHLEFAGGTVYRELFVGRYGIHWPSTGGYEMYFYKEFTPHIYDGCTENTLEVLFRDDAEDPPRSHMYAASGSSVTAESWPLIVRWYDIYNDPPNYDYTISVPECRFMDPTVLNTVFHLAQTAVLDEYMGAYINGNIVDVMDLKGSSIYYSSSANGVEIGGNYNNWLNDVYMGEVRFSGIARSAAWIKATYYSNIDDLFVYSLPLIAPTGNGYQTSYHTVGDVYANSIIGRGYQTSYYVVGNVVQVQPVVGYGYQTSYHIGSVIQIQPVTSFGYQWAYALGVVGVKPPQKEPVDGMGYQVSYHIGSVVQVQTISCLGHQYSYGFVYNYLHIHELDAVVTPDKYDVIVEGPYYEAVDD